MKIPQADTARSYFLSSLHAQQSLAARAVTPQEVAIVDWNERKELRRFRSDTGNVKALSLHPDGQHVAVAGVNGIKVWAADGSSTPVAGQAENLAFSPDGGLLYLAEPGRLSAVEWSQGSVLWTREEPDFRHPGVLALNSESKRLAWTAMGGHRVHLLDPISGEVTLTVGGQDEITAVAFHPDLRRLALCIHTQRHQLPFHVQIWSIGSDEAFVPDREIAIMNSSVALAISPGGGTIATGDGQGCQLWDNASGNPERCLAERELSKMGPLGTVERPRKSLVSAIRFDGEHVITDGEYLRVWRAADGELVWTFTG